MVVTRIAPSPTGFAHVGTLYVALFNYAYARKRQGRFVLRIEDTDEKRYVKGADKEIVKGLEWAGLEFDKGPIKQSKRLSVYKKFVDDLVGSGKAYEKEGAIWLKVNSLESVSWNDLVRGTIEFPGEEFGDFVIVRSNGLPVYNFAVVVDDHEMGVDPVIRGEEHISNTPRQLLIYKALGFDAPKFAHIPLLRNKDKSKISKRNDPVDLEWFRREGYLPQALINFLALLGWSHPDGKEIFGLDEFVRKFSLGRVLTSGPVFDLEKLDWINGHYIRQLTVDALNSKFRKRNANFEKLEGRKQISITSLIQTRIKKLGEFEQMAGFFFKRPKVDTKLFGKNYKRHLKVAMDGIKDGLSLDTLPGKHDFKVGDFFMDLRIAITGSRFTPPINESIVILGKDETIKRLKSIPGVDSSEA